MESLQCGEEDDTPRNEAAEWIVLSKQTPLSVIPFFFSCCQTTLDKMDY